MQPLAKLGIKLKRGEKVLKIVHRNWANVVSQYLLLAVVILIIFGAYYFIPDIYEESNTNYYSTLLIENIALLILWIYGFIVWIDYYFDVWIITNKRIINVEQVGLFERQALELSLSSIKSVNAHMEGMFSSIANYGDIEIISEKDVMILRRIGDPLGIRSYIMHTKDR